ncbi:LCP family protein [Streptomyces fractus]|uniref:LCP family protein n=1 Tax=Streptomyces fractus TaxID=641806 RepID=UPI003CFA651A
MGSRGKAKLFSPAWSALPSGEDGRGGKTKPGRRRKVQPGRRRKARTRRQKVVRWGVWICVALLLAGAGTAGYAYWRLNHNITSLDLSSILSPGDDSGEMNILVMGVDSRSGENGDLAGGDTDGTSRSDTTAVVHINQEHTKASVVWISRDTLVDIPRCTGSDGQTIPAQQDAMFNSAYGEGGAACTVKTVEQLSGLELNHYVELDFSGFVGFVNDIGGVTITTTEDIDDPDSGFDEPAGTHHLGGDEALAYVRTRHGVGDGSDLDRITLEQQMADAIITRLQSLGLAAHPKQAYNIASDLTKSVTTDSGLASVNALLGLAGGMAGIGPSDVTQVTLPNEPAPSDPNRVEPKEPEAGQVWDALKKDQAIPSSIVGSQRQNPADSKVSDGTS